MTPHFVLVVGCQRSGTTLIGERDLLREIFRDPELQELDRALREADPYAQLSGSAGCPGRRG